MKAISKIINFIKAHKDEILFIAICIWLIPLLWKTISEQISDGDDTQVTFFLLAVLVVVVCGEFLGINMVVGAFIAGLALSRLVKHTKGDIPLLARFESIGYGLLIPFLFISIGMDSDLKAFLQIENLYIILFTVTGLVASKIFSGWISMRLSGFGNRQGLCAGLMTVPQLSATLAAAAVGKDLGMLDDNFFNAIIVLSIVTTIPIPTIVRLIIERTGVKFTEEKYLNLKKGDDIYYVDQENNEIEHGIVFSVAFKDWKVDSFSVDFDCGDFDEFSSGALGKYYFTNKEDAEFSLRNGT